jgi:hypothetical protein
LIQPEKLPNFSGQKRWIFIAGIGSPGKVWHDRTLEAVGSTPIGSINLFKGLETVPPLETFPGLPIVRIFVRMFLIPGGHRGDRCRFLFLFVQDKPAGALSFL